MARRPLRVRQRLTSHRRWEEMQLKDVTRTAWCYDGHARGIGGVAKPANAWLGIWCCFSSEIPASREMHLRVDHDISHF